MNTGIDENFAVSQTKVDEKCQIGIKLKIWQNLMNFSWPFFFLDAKNSISPVPHVERIPCRYDDVQFPSDKESML
jgi:hypothetical protein